MPLEIEIKFKVDDPAALREKLAAAGAQRVGEVLESNVFFDTPDDSLRQQGTGLRLRTEYGPDGSELRTLVTAKGPRRPGELKIRSEHELVAASHEEGRAFLQTLGYRSALTFAKRRETFRLGDAEIVIDELPELGFFMEIEAPTEQRVQDVRGRLGLADEPTVTDSYPAIVREHLDGTVAGKRELLFR